MRISRYAFFKCVRTLLLGTFILAGSFSPSWAQEGFKSFWEETVRATKALNCPNHKITPASPGWGSLYGCIKGKAATAKFWINESSKKRGVVRNVKVLWNDWFKDLGYGIHPDQVEATKMVLVVSKLFMPELKDNLLKIFFGKTNRKIKHGSLIVEFKYHRGPAIDERVLVVSRDTQN